MLFFSVYEEDPDLNNEMEVSVSTCGVSHKMKLGYWAKPHIDVAYTRIWFILFHEKWLQIAFDVFLKNNSLYYFVVIKFYKQWNELYDFQTKQKLVSGSIKD